MAGVGLLAALTATVVAVTRDPDRSRPTGSTDLTSGHLGLVREPCATTAVASIVALLIVGPNLFLVHQTLFA